MRWLPSQLLQERWLLWLLPLTIVVGYIWFHISDEWYAWNRSEVQQHWTSNVSELTNLVYELQKERGYSSGYLASNGKQFRAELQMHRANTDQHIQQQIIYLSGHTPFNEEDANFHLLLEEMLRELSQLELVRRHVDGRTVEAHEAIENYTGFVKIVLKLISKLVIQIADVELVNRFFVLPSLLRIGETLGQERALLTDVFTSDRLLPGMYERWNGLQGEREAHIETLLALSSNRYRDIFQAMDNEATHSQLNHFRSLIVSRHAEGGFAVDPKEWFDAATRMIDLLRDLGSTIQKDTHLLAAQRIRLAARQFWKQMAGGILLLLAVGALAMVATLAGRSRILLREVAERKRHEAELSKLHHALDQTPMTVVITDIAGTIEYVNKTCIQSTGYSQEELLGQNPRLLKTNYTNKEVYATMWRTILAGEVWQGEFYNRRKDKGCYWEMASISPVRDPEGNIRHFLAIKEDITAKKLQEKEDNYRRKLLEMVASGATLEEIYGLVMQYVEELFPGVVSCFAMVNREENRLHCLTAPRLRNSGLADYRCPAEQGIAVQSEATPCAIAAHRKELILLESIDQQTPWSANEGNICRFGVQSFWSIPIIGEGGEVLGTLAGYDREKRFDEHFFGNRLAPLLQLVGIAIKRQHREEALRIAASKADAANRSKSAFLANMSHEIRTPLHAIIGALELAQDSSPVSEHREQLQLAYGSARALLILINDLLDYAKIEAGQLRLDLAPFNLPDLLKELTATMAIPARKKRILLSCSLPDDWPVTVYGDGNRLKQVLINLLGNAIKFTPEEGSVELRGELIATHDEELELLFDVRDTGVGIPEEKRQRIFDRFTQADESITRRFGGTGLGLAISRDLVNMMGGRIAVEPNPAAPVGSRFYFTIRVKLLSAGDVAALIPASHEKTSLLSAAASEEKGTQESSLLAEAAILVVDDQPTNLKITQGMLVRLGCRKEQIVCVADGLQAVERYQTGRFDLILMDCQMPVMDGYQASRAIRQWEQERGKRPIPIIAFTADVTEESRRNGVSAGMDDFLSKPVFMVPLRQMLDIHLGRKAEAVDMQENNG
ncbi:nitrate- and nitrite sensing domain-containing protein [Candidatus Magnetaquicoccus inordinatus]|uniref:nitrate- and nitrite sensing domain-containing protein n=1 Tax=Candidatus Magnetaquicoccus inordinatus TaxID=2496818 RepID=UPI00102C8939|nr:nitrate- and nitrite sensing domain-containing protein [Candidatus Magnetaquicoccus inordinatus]